MPVNKAALTAPFPASAVKSREVGRGNYADYIEGHTVINRLNMATDNEWNMEVVDFTLTDALAIARVRLTLPGLGSREHIGIQEVRGSGNADLLKGAITDALKKTASLFGVGIELYGDDYEAEGYEEARPAQRPPQNRPAPRPPQNQGGNQGGGQGGYQNQGTGNQPQERSGPPAECFIEECSTVLTQAEDSFSRSKFGMPLCRVHQQEARNNGG